MTLDCKKFNFGITFMNEIYLFFNLLSASEMVYVVYIFSNQKIYYIFSYRPITHLDCQYIM